MIKNNVTMSLLYKKILMIFLERLMCWTVEKACSNAQGLKWQFTFSQEHVVIHYIVVTQKYEKLKVTLNIDASTFLILL